MKEPICPLVKKPCLEAGCMFWTHIQGTHPQSGAKVDNFDCSIKWLPMLLVENARQTRGAQASIDSMRNEVVKRQDELNGAVRIAQNAPPKVTHDG